MSLAGAMVLAVSEPFSSRQRPRESAALADLTLIVRPPGKPAEIRVFTDARRAEAEAYAAEFGPDVAVEPLPFAPPGA